MRLRSTRAPLWLLCAASLALAAHGCFDWDDYLTRCKQANNCPPPPPPAGDAGDGGDGGGTGGQDGGGDGGNDGGAIPDDGGTLPELDSGTRLDSGVELRSKDIGQPCAEHDECGSATCVGNHCVCATGSPCRDENDCCLGEICNAGTCEATAIPFCAGTGSTCAMPCCSSVCDAGACTCSPPGQRCNSQNDCCTAATVCSAGKYCCEVPTAPCTQHAQCCSRVCFNNACL